MLRNSIQSLTIELFDEVALFNELNAKIDKNEKLSQDKLLCKIIGSKKVSLNLIDN